MKMNYETKFYKENKKEIENKLKELELESIEDFEPEFYYQNLVNGYQINRRAVEILKYNHSLEELILVENYDEIGIVESVEKNQYYIENNKIKGYE